ncbi:MAG: RNA helicase, partial [Actinomycetota bacterium]
SVGRVKVPRDFNPRSPAARRDLASSLRNALAPGRQDATSGGLLTSPGPGKRAKASRDRDVEAEITRLRRQLRQHPCHGCAEREDHARWAERHHRLQRETDQLARRIEGRTNTIARTFDRVCDLLVELGYLRQSGAELEVTAAGARLRGIYSEKDLLVAECLRHGVWADLDAAGLAAVVSAVVYEARRETEGFGPRTPGGAVRAALAETVRIWSGITDREEQHRVEVTGEPDAGLALAVHRWANGARLETVLEETDVAAGDFVRWCRQVLDLLGQLEQVADATGDRALRRTTRQAAAAVDRGVVAYAVGGGLVAARPPYTDEEDA